jgi:uncharacterized membrane protein
MEGLGSITAAAIAFVGTHLLLSHPLRQPIVGAVGNAAFLGIYSVIAAATLAWLALAYHAAPAGCIVLAGLRRRAPRSTAPAVFRTRSARSPGWPFLKRVCTGGLPRPTG